MPETIEISELTDEELLDYAKELGLNPRKNAKRVTVEAMIAEAAAELLDASLDVQGIEDTEEAEAAPAPTADDEAEQRRNKRYLLTLNSDGEPGGHDPLPLGINGEVVTIPRDVEVEVNGDVIAQLNDLVVTEYDQIGEDDEKRPIYKERNVKRFSFSYHQADQ